jgi:hypothetical protein
MPHINMNIQTVQDTGITDTVKSGWGSISATVSSVVQPIGSSGSGSGSANPSDSYNYNYNFSATAAPHPYMSQQTKTQQGVLYFMIYIYIRICMYFILCTVKFTHNHNLYFHIVFSTDSSSSGGWGGALTSLWTQ